MRNPTRLLASLLVLLTIGGPAAADALLGPSLQSRLLQDPGPYEVVVTFESTAAVPMLDQLGVPTLKLQTLPMAGALLTKDQIETVRRWDSVVSIYHNDRLEYHNFTSGEITGGHFVHDNYGVKGAGVTIAVLDSGVDASHPDLASGSKTVQNVKIVGDLGLLGGQTVFLEGQINSDTSSGHGTHVAGTVAGSGAASAADERRPFYYAGIAPEASLVGIGAGEGISILYALLGFDYAIANQDRLGIDIITNSWGGGDGNNFDPNDPINQASFEAYRRGMVVTFAASNSGPDENTLNQYAIAPWVINVAAGTPTKELADFSSRGVAGDSIKHPDITAPGEGITSTRAPNTAIGALGPVVDPAHPDYYLRYHTISGTSMATPFVAGVAALLLGENPQLSPDQVEEILMATADPMPGYAFHQVGTGYIDVREAVDVARTTVGERVAFLAGDTKWSSQGPWLTVADADDRLSYDSRWRNRSSSLATDGLYKYVNARNGGVLRARFEGEGIKLSHPRDRNGGVAELYIDGVNRDTVSFYGSEPSFGNEVGFNGLGEGLHVLELRALQGNAYVDGLLVDGMLWDETTQFVDQTLVYSGSIGPSAENLETHTIQFEVGPDVVKIAAQLAWTGLFDLDLYLVDPDGNVVASGATLANPEFLAFSVTRPGIYTYRVTGYISVIANYTLTSTLTRAVTP